MRYFVPIFLINDPPENPESKNQLSPLKVLNPPENPDTQKNLDDLTQMRATLAERLGVSENEIEMMALKYLLHATESRAL